MKRKAVFVTLDVYERTVPLVAGYLQSYACLDPEIEENWEFERYANTAEISFFELEQDLKEIDADVFAFSCYVWNMRLVRRVLDSLLTDKPHTNIILGGPQVMHCAEKYLNPKYESLVLCNGEGEKTFRNYLKELSETNPDLARVKGLSFYRDWTLVTTEEEARISDLDEIPSPYLNGIIETNKYTLAHVETNRGCPFKCAYCYWGGAVGTKVHKVGEERIKAELTWLASNGIFSIFFIDANWGMLPRDVDFSRHLAECKKKYNMPQTVIFCGAKNNPDRVAEITRIFHDAGLLTAQSVALQTMNDRALEMVNRKNIKTESYINLQKELNDNSISSYIDIIWPLPGETLTSFRAGINQLCEARADAFMFYPLLLFNNVELDEKKVELGLVTELSSNPNSEARVVVQTNEVSHDDFLEGWRFIFATLLLYNLRGLYSTAYYLNRFGIQSYAGLFSEFADFLKANPNSPLSQLCKTLFELRTVEFASQGQIVHHICHAERELVDAFLFQFVSSRPWWKDRTAQIYFEIDLLNRPYVYSNTEILEKSVTFQHLNVLDVAHDGYIVELREGFGPLLKESVGAKANIQSNIVKVNHRQNQIPFMSAESLEHNWGNLAYRMGAVGEFLPTWNHYDGYVEGLKERGGERDSIYEFIRWEY